MSIVHITERQSSKNIVDRTSFIGHKVPDQIKSMIKTLKKVDKNLFRKCLQIVVEALEGKNVGTTKVNSLISKDLSEEDVIVVYSGLLQLLQLSLRIPQHSLKQELYREDLAEMRIPEEFVPDLASVVYGSRRETINSHATETKSRLPKIESLRWRVDVAISTSALSRALEPSILMEMKLSDGKIHTFEMSASKFHELRYNVTSVLKDMEDLEKRSILKIQD